MATLSSAACSSSQRGRSRAPRRGWARACGACLAGWGRPGGSRRQGRSRITFWGDEVAYTDLGADYYTQRDNPDMQKARLVRQLKELGYDVEISPAA